MFRVPVCPLVKSLSPCVNTLACRRVLMWWFLLALSLALSLCTGTVFTILRGSDYCLGLLGHCLRACSSVVWIKFVSCQLTAEPPRLFV